MRTSTAPHQTLYLRHLLSERVAQVDISAGEHELADAISTVLDMVEQADRSGHHRVSTAALRLAVRKGLQL